MNRIRRRIISVTHHWRISSKGKEFFVRKHHRHIRVRKSRRNSRHNRRNYIHLYRNDRRQRYSKTSERMKYEKAVPAGIIRFQLKQGAQSKPHEYQKKTAFESERYLRDLSLKYPRLAGFAVEGKGADLEMVPILLYSSDELQKPEYIKSLNKDIADIYTDLTNDIDRKFFADRNKLNPKIKYRFKSGQVLNNFTRMNIVRGNERKGRLYKTSVVLAHVDETGKIRPHNFMSVYLIPEIETSAEKTGGVIQKDIYRRRVSGPDGDRWLKWYHNQILIDYADKLREYQYALKDYNVHGDNATKNHARSLERQMRQYQKVISKIYNDRGMDVSPLPNYDFSPTAKKINENIPIEYSTTSGRLDRFTDPHSFAIIDMEKKKPLDPKKIQKDAIKSNKKIGHLKSEKGIGFYIDPYYFFSIDGKDADEQLKKINRDFPTKLGYYKDADKFFRKVIWSDYPKLDRLRIIYDQDEPLIDRQREWNYMAKKMVDSSISRDRKYKTNLDKIKLLHREPISWSPSEKRLVEDIIDIKIPPLPDSNIAYHPNPFEYLPEEKEKGKKKESEEKPKKEGESEEGHEKED